MLKKSLLRVTAILVCFAIITMVVPGTVQAKSGKKSTFKKIFEKPAAFFSSLLSFLPFFNSDNDKSADSYYGSKGVIRGMKTTGELNSKRPSDDD
jgi:hypothetical protein